MTCVVMVIEDEISQVNLIQRVLESANYMVIATNEGTDAIDMAIGILPDIILLDIHLSNVDGWHILEALKANPQTTAIPVILCTNDQDRERALQLGAVSILSKPLGANQILEAVQYIHNLQSSPSAGN